jgi:hypothetical protein
MSARTGGSPAWLIRPIVDGVILGGTLFFGKFEDAIAEANRRHTLTGIQHTVREA